MGKSYRSTSTVLRSVIALAAILATLMWGRVAHADAAPVQMILLYMPNVSNTGTTKASGVAELVMSEGEVRIKAADLPRLDNDKQYVAWVVNTNTNQFQRLGAFNTSDSSGSVAYETVEPDAIPDKSWNLLLITVEDSADADAPGKRHSIAGVFPSADNAPLPVALPNTGGAPDTETCQSSAISCQLDAVGEQLSLVSRAEWLAASVLSVLALSVTFGAGFALGHKRR
jgi:hypothetical protein